MWHFAFFGTLLSAGSGEAKNRELERTINVLSGALQSLTESSKDLSRNRTWDIMQIKAEFRLDIHVSILSEARGNAAENANKALWLEVGPML